MTQNEKLLRLRKLHGIPVRNARMAAMSIAGGGLMLLILGLRLIIADLMGQSGTVMLAAGMLICFMGWVLIMLRHPVYRWIITRHRRRIAPKVLQLAEELLM